MSIAFRCTGCRCRIHVPQRRAGATVACPRCATRVVVPADSESPSVPRFEQPDIERSLRSLQPVAGGTFAEETFELPPAHDIVSPAAAEPARRGGVTVPRWAIYALMLTIPAAAVVGFVCGYLWAAPHGR